MRNPRTAFSLGLAALVGTALLLAGCSSAGDSQSSADSGDAAGSVQREPADGAADQDNLSALEEGPAYSLRDGPARAADEQGQAGNRPPARIGAQQALIRRGTVELSADDVGAAQRDVQKVVDRYAGQVSDEETTTGEDGAPAWTRMVLRVPSSDFDAAMADLKGVAELESATTTQEDVTAKMIDTRTRLQVQQRSIARISLLLDRAQSIGDIMRIESQLSQRQARLDSLKRRLAYLSAQTSMSTITVHIDQTAAKAKAAEDDDDGFVAGLKAGWSGLSSFTVGLATVAGALLPWLIVLALVAPPALLVARWARRRISAGRAGRTGRTPSAA